MEADSLKTLAEMRELERTLGAAVAAAEGNSSSGPGMRQGFAKVQQGTQALQSGVEELCTGLEAERRRFAQLHTGWRVRCKWSRVCSPLPNPNLHYHPFILSVPVQQPQETLVARTRALVPCCLAQEVRARAEALLFFSGRQEAMTEDGGSEAEDAPLDPGLEELASGIQAQLHALRRQALQLSDCLEVR